MSELPEALGICNGYLIATRGISQTLGRRRFPGPDNARIHASNVEAPLSTRTSARCQTELRMLSLVSDESRLRDQRQHSTPEILVCVAKRRMLNRNQYHLPRKKKPSQLSYNPWIPGCSTPRRRIVLCASGSCKFGPTYRCLFSAPSCHSRPRTF